MGKNKKNNELRLERFFGNGIIIAVVLIVEDLLLYMLINYLFNIIVNLGLGTGNWSHPEYYIGIKNILPDFERIHKYHDIYGFICLVYGCFCLVFNIRQGYRMRASFSSKGFNLNQKGCARWTTTKEIKRQYSRIPEKDKVFPGYGGTIVSRIGKHLFIDTDLTNNLCIGITRSGKGEMYVIPSIDVYSRAEKKTSMVVLDPKTELYKTSKETLEERGYDVYLLSLVDPEHSMGFNPLNQVINLYEAGDYANAELLVQTFCYSIFNPDKPINGDTFWQDSPTSLLSALVLQEKREKNIFKKLICFPSSIYLENWLAKPIRIIHMLRDWICFSKCVLLWTGQRLSFLEWKLPEVGQRQVSIPACL